MENPAIEKQAADLILKKGVRLKLRAPFFFRWLGKKTIGITVTSPYEGTLHEVARHYLSTGLLMEDLEGITHEKGLAIMALHGPAMDKAVAAAWLNGFWAIKLFTRPLAWYMRWNAKPAEILTIVMLLILYGGLSDFMDTTRSIRMMKMTSPMVEGQTMTKGS